MRISQGMVLHQLARVVAEMLSFSCEPMTTAVSPGCVWGTLVMSTTVWSMVMRPRTGQRLPWRRMWAFGLADRGKPSA